MRLVAAGLSFHSAPLWVRERAVISDSEAQDLLRYLVGHPGLIGAAVLSTCNRTELYVCCSDDELAGQVGDRLGRHLDPGNQTLAEHMVSHYDDDAVNHLCRVAAGLESMVVGESQVLGQVRAAHRVALEAGTLGPELDLVFRGALESAKRVRTTTAIGRGSGSLSEVALDAAAEVVGDLNGAAVLLIGAGKMSRLAARRLGELGAKVRITSRSESARKLARELGAEAIDRDNLLDVIGDIDLVISSTSSSAPVITTRDAAIWQAHRRGRPLCIIDLAVPRDVEEGAAAVDGIHLVDIDELGGRVDQGMDGRRRAVPAAKKLIAADVIAIRTRLDQRQGAGSTIGAIVEQAEALRFAEVERGLARIKDLDPAVRDGVDALTRSLVKRLLHAPIEHLRGHADCAETVAVVRQSFGIETPDAADIPEMAIAAGQAVGQRE